MELIEIAKELGSKIQESEEFLNFKSAKEKMDSDEVLIDLKKRFDEKKEELNREMAKENSKKEIIKKLSEDLRDFYSQINDSPSMCAFESAKRALDSLVDNIVTIINSSAHGEFPTKNFLSSCSGSCDSCMGCF